MTNPFIVSPLWAILPNQIDSVFQMRERQLDFYANRQTEADANTDQPTPVVGALDNGDLFQGIPATYTIENGVGILPIQGMIIPKSDIFTLIFGGFAALDILTRDFRELAGRDDVHTIVLDIDSPGGNAFGVQQFANLIFNSRADKSIIAVTSGMMASAAMWIGAAAHKIVITGDVTVVGSIGTVTSHVDISEAEKMAGIKTTEVAAGKFKRVPSMFEPLTTKGKQVLQGQVNHANTAFINDIAKFRGVIPSTVVSKMAEGKTFIGTQGISVGLIDEMLTMEEVLNNTTDSTQSVRFISNNKSISNHFEGGNGMTIAEQIAEMKNSSPDLYEAMVNIGRVEATAASDKALPDALSVEHAKGVEAGKLEGIEAGKKAEHERITSLGELATAGNKDMVDKFIADGKTTAPEAAVEILKAQKTANADGLEALKKQSPDAVDADIIDDTTGDTEKTLSQHVEAYMAANNVSKGTAITACSTLYPNAKNDFIVKIKRNTD